MRRVVVTGLGIVSSIGSNAEEVTASLHDAKSGISFSESFAEHGFRCQVWGAPTLEWARAVPSFPPPAGMSWLKSSPFDDVKFRAPMSPSRKRRPD